MAPLRTEREDAINDLVTALIAFKRSVCLDERNQVISVDELAPTLAQFLINLAAWLQPLLGEELQKEMSDWLRIAEHGPLSPERQADHQLKGEMVALTSSFSLQLAVVGHACSLRPKWADAVRVPNSGRK
jgi:hypothetical protein